MEDKVSADRISVSTLVPVRTFVPAARPRCPLCGNQMGEVQSMIKMRTRSEEIAHLYDDGGYSACDECGDLISLSVAQV